MRRIPAAFGVAILAMLANDVRADLPPPQLGTIYARATHRIETQFSLADFAVVIVRESAQFGDKSVEYVAISPELPLIISGAGRDSVHLVVVPRDAVRGKSPEEIAVLAHSIPGSLVQAFYFREVVPKSHPSEIVIHHRLERKNDGGLELVRTSRSPMIGYYIMAAIPPLAFVIAGLLFIRWFFRRRRGPQSDPPTPVIP